jgi:glycosyltransferase involved in cell wall biosynthesis
VLERKGVRCRFVREHALRGRWSGLAPVRIARAALEERPKLIHVNGLDFAAHTRAMTATGLPVLVQDHASRAGRRRRQRRWGLAGIAGAAFTDAEQARPFIDEASISERAQIFSVPESSTWFAPGDRDEARRATGTFGDPMVLWIGRLDENKDPLTILRAIEIAAHDLTGMQMWCCFHEHPLLAVVEATIRSSPALAAHVHLLGRVPHDTIELLCRAADIFVSGSHHEGSGYALIEALACGATPVVSDIPPFRRIAGQTGYLAAVADVQCFAAGLVRVAREPRADLRRRALVHFNAKLSFRAVGSRLREVYEALAHRSA